MATAIFRLTENKTARDQDHYSIFNVHTTEYVCTMQCSDSSFYRAWPHEMHSTRQTDNNLHSYIPRQQVNC